MFEDEANDEDDDKRSIVSEEAMRSED